jgi:carboxyl-terminal processing protease
LGEVRLRVIVPAVLCGLVLLVGGIWLGSHPSLLPDPVRDAVVGDEQAQLVNEAIREVQDRYFKAIPESELADRSIAGLVASLKDPFSSYFSPKAYREFQEVQRSAFSGVGLTVSQDPRGLRVVEVFADSPARKAGIGRGDVVVAAGGRPLKGLRQDRAVALIKGPEGSKVRLTVLQDGKERELDLTRATIAVPAVASRVVRDGARKVGYLRLAQFSSGSHAEVYAAIKKLQARKVDGFVFDLRGNGGGLVSEAQLIASAWLPDGKIVTTRGRAVPERTLQATGDPVEAKAPLVVLVDRDSASASEIVAGALQDDDRATLVGTRTYGKGVFQQVIELSNGGALDITAGQYFTPDGRNLGGEGTARGKGLAPDVRAQDDPRTERDEALDRAVEVVTDGT